MQLVARHSLHIAMFTYSSLSHNASLPACRSTFDPNIGSELYKHIKTPPFIPPSLNEPQLAWIFMGSPGPGASIHVRFAVMAVSTCSSASQHSCLFASSGGHGGIGFLASTAVWHKDLDFDPTSRV